MRWRFGRYWTSILLGTVLWAALNGGAEKGSPVLTNFAIRGAAFLACMALAFAVVYGLFVDRE